MLIRTKSSHMDQLSPILRHEPACSDDSAKSRRGCGRVRIEDMPCNMGTVVDLSASGIRVITNKASARKMGRTLTVKLQGPKQRIELEAEVVWVKRIGLRKHIVGLRFVEASGEQRTLIAQIARCYAVRVAESA